MNYKTEMLVKEIQQLYGIPMLELRDNYTRIMTERKTIEAYRAGVITEDEYVVIARAIRTAERDKMVN